MKFLLHTLNVIAVLVSVFLLLSLITAELFGLYTIARACGLVRRADVKLILEIALTVAYGMAIVGDAVNEFPHPVRAQLGVPSRRAVHNRRDVLSRKQQYKPGEERALLARP